MGAEGMPKEVELAHHKRLESRLDKLTSVMTGLTKRLMGKGTGQAMEYEEKSVHNVPTTAHNTVVSMAKKVEDNVLHVMTVPVIMPPSAMPKSLVTNPPSTLLRALNTLVIK